MQLVTPIANGTIDPNGFNNPSAPAYVVNGAAGRPSSSGLQSTC